MREIVLINITGKDKPGLTARPGAFGTGMNLFISQSTSSENPYLRPVSRHDRPPSLPPTA
jgi:hypothetical protein